MYGMFFTLRNFEEKKSTAKFEQNLKKKILLLDPQNQVSGSTPKN